MESPHVSELIRRIENLLRLGTISHVNAKGYRVRVAAGGLASNWLPWLSVRAGTTRTWSPPTVGEQCLLISPGGDLVNGVALVGLFSDAIPPNDDRDNVDATHYPDGTVHEYDHEAHRDLLKCVGDVLRQIEGNVLFDVKGDITHQAQGAVVIASETSITLRVGDAKLELTPEGIKATPDVIAGGISQVNHVHGGVRSGNDKSSKPS
ncbi:MAG: phage baseplate assembly protein V [Roseateles depolymerans]|uniref:Phage baseplate assembly protein V n=1 Tax=Roseateles depolymerans TaxID=76731 RepID=A0A2W5FLQ5_9BURK|nr:MAG: phage baseplate assembly protein V [Roseateles depolymerans]